MSAILVNEHHARQDVHGVRLRDENRPRYRLALSLLPPGEGKRLIDVGGGAGELVAMARLIGYHTTLVDGNPNNVAAERASGHDAIEVDLNHGLAAIPDNTFDVAVCLEVIEHIVPAEMLLREICRTLKPNGLLVLSTPNFSFLKDRVDYLRGCDVFEEGYHFRFYTKRRLTQMLEAAGFEKTDAASVGSAIGLNRILRAFTLGAFRLKPFRVPEWAESVLARTFIWQVRKTGDARRG